MKTAYDIALSLSSRTCVTLPVRDEVTLPVIQSAFQSFHNRLGLRATFTPFRRDGPWAWDLFHGRTTIAHAAPWQGELSWGVCNLHKTTREWVYRRSRPKDFTGEFGEAMSYVVAWLQQGGPEWLSRNRTVRPVGYGFWSGGPT